MGTVIVLPVNLLFSKLYPCSIQWHEILGCSEHIMKITGSDLMFWEGETWLELSMNSTAWIFCSIAVREEESELKAERGRKDYALLMTSLLTVGTGLLALANALPICDAVFKVSSHQGLLNRWLPMDLGLRSSRQTNPFIPAASQLIWHSTIKACLLWIRETFLNDVSLAQMKVLLTINQLR